MVGSRKSKHTNARTEKAKQSLSIVFGVGAALAYGE